MFEEMAGIVMQLFTKQEGTLTIEFVYSPFYEMMCSLHVLTRPEHHMERLKWAEEIKSKLPSLLYEELLYFGTNYSDWCGAMEFSHICEGVNDLNVIAVLDSIAMIDANEFIRILNNENDNSAITDTADTLQRRFIACLKTYYFQFFENELRYIEPLLIRILKKQAAICDNIGIKAYIKMLHNRIEVTDTQLIFHKYRSFIFSFDTLRKLSVNISSFINPHLMLGIIDSAHLHLTYRALLQEAVQQVPVDLYKKLSALGDDTRLRILKIIRHEQSSTQSLAKELKLTEACISKHLKIMYEAELLYKQRKGNYIYYFLNLMQLDWIPMDIYQYLDGGIQNE